MPEHNFEAGELHVYSVNTETMEYGVKPVAVFRADEVDEEEQQVRGEILWTNDERLATPSEGEHRVDDGRISSPFVHCEKLED